MRFVRAYVRSDTGEVIAVHEGETPLDAPPKVRMVPVAGGPDVAVEIHEVGLVEDFDPVDLAGEPCSPARHLHLRIRRHADGRFHAAPGHELPKILDCPCSLGGIEARVRAHGPAGIPAVARAWLTLMLPPETTAGLGVAAGIPVSALRALDAQRQRRDPEAGTRLVVLERAAQERSDVDAARRLARRQGRNGGSNGATEA